jgi:hypothetical protein
MRTARSWTSGENFGDVLMLAPFSIEGASSKSGAVHRPGPVDMWASRRGRLGTFFIGSAGDLPTCPQGSTTTSVEGCPAQVLESARDFDRLKGAP